tara:strand:+ start:114 stop:710 length:597 start_codon:yes stop_codon:yes gene_type:complete
VNNKFPYQKLLRDKTVGDWEAFKRINFQLQEKAKINMSIAEEIFALKITLDEQWNKWFIIATNKYRTNDRTKKIVSSLWKEVSIQFKNHNKNEPFTKSGFWRRNGIKVFLQIINLDFFFYGNSFRSVYSDTLGGLVLSAIGLNLFFYGIPIFLTTFHPLFIIVLLVSAYIQAYLSYQRTIRFYYKNQINKIITQPNNK